MGVARRAASERRELVRRLIAEKQSTGETWRSISARTGINYATLTGWVWRMSRGAARRPAAPRAHAEFIELVPTEPSPTRADLELVLHGERRVRIAAGFDAATLVRLVQALEAC